MSPITDYRTRIFRALEYAREHLDENPSLSELADAAAFSPFHFHRIFAALTGETPAEHIRRLRLEKAANSLLYKPTIPVTRIALDCGFATPSAFSRDFRARFGITPQNFRKRKLGRDGAAGYSAPAAFAFRTTADTTIDYRYETLTPLCVAYCSHVGPYGPGIGKAWGTLMRWAGPRALIAPEARIYGISWDNPDITGDGQLRYDACLEVPQGTEGSGDIHIRDLPAFRCIVLPYKGPERGLSAAYSRLYYEILPQSTCEPEDFPAFERYLSMPKGLFSRRFDLEIYLPVKPLT
ncbi:MAG: AraC family transcriptional regulator [Treponemataceae bacterium]